MKLTIPRAHFWVASLFVMIFSFTSFGQVVGGRENGQMTPKVAEATELSGGGFVGDVNIMTGEFNSTIPLGSVSTPSGLSFDLNLSYNSSFSIGHTKPMCSGIPYGDGWSPSIPSISVSTDGFHKYIKSLECEENEPESITSPSRLKYNDGTEYSASDEGDLYWFSPRLSIPGVASGRAVFKYIDVQDNGCAVFVLNKFESPVEIRFYGSKWTAKTASGVLYEFDRHVTSYRAPNNRRILYYDQGATQQGVNAQAIATVKDGEYNGLESSVKNVIEPK